jgi:PIN domain nuclease of toxin-antitoxin system
VSRVVLDASAILAVIHQERGSEKLSPEMLGSAAVSTVNLSEVVGKLVISGWSAADAWEDATSLVQEIVPFSSEHARVAGKLITQTRHLGLSLADRACLALGLDLKAPVYTADRSWKSLKLGVRIHVIR